LEHVPVDPEHVLVDRPGSGKFDANQAIGSRDIPKRASTL